MKTFLLSIFALAVVAAPVMGEDDKDNPKQPKNNRNQNTPQRQVNTPPRTFTPRTVTPRVNNNPSANAQFQPRNRPPTTARTFPKSYTPDVQARLRNPRNFTPPNQDAPRTNNNWQTNTWKRNNWNSVTPQTPNPNVQADTNVRNRNWRDRANTNRNWRNDNRAGTFTYEQAQNRFRRDRHDRNWWRSRYNRIVLFGGGYYYWDNNYWYPAYGYDSSYNTYAYNEPIYGYNELAPGQVIANVQTALQEQGYYNDAVDGLIGPRTRAAVSNFQRDRGLPITAAIDGPTLQALGLY